jgi:hypothetical protein
MRTNVIASVLLVILGCCGSARADGPTDFQQASTLKGAGIALTVTGAVTIVASYATAIAWIFNSFSTHPDPGLEIGAAVLLAAGGAQLGTGIALLVIGKRRERAQRATLSLAATGFGGTF